MAEFPYAEGRRAARLAAPGSVDAVLVLVIHEVLAPSWTAAMAAQTVLEQVGGNSSALRSARNQIRKGLHDPITVSQARALATLNVAIAEAEGSGGR
jgi:hypothetical protein